MISKSKKKEQGAAMVEFAIMMLVLVPLLLYGFFISDAAYHQLEVQETVLATIWDFSARQHNKTHSGGGDRQSNIDAVQAANRMEYSDHTSSYDDPGDVQGNKESHHNQLAVHACFFGGHDGSTYEDASSSTQVTCTVDKSKDLEWMSGGLSNLIPAAQTVLKDGLPAEAFGSDDDFQHGGQAYCWAKAWAYNFIVPEDFLSGFSHVKLSEKKDHTGTISSGSNVVHSINGQGGSTSNVFLRDKASLSFDTWALDNAGEVDPKKVSDSNHQPGPNNEFYRRVNKLYQREGAFLVTYGVVAVANTLLFNTARSKVIYIPAIPFLPASSIAGSLPGGLGSLGSLVGQIGLEPSNPSGVYMTARWDPSTSSPGYGNYCNMLLSVSCAGGVFGVEYQTTPYSTSNSKPTTYWSQHGGCYMGAKGGDCTKEWKP